MKNSEETSNIAIWGAVGSGKTWLIRSFGKTLLKYSASDKDFQYEITDKDGHVVDGQAPNVQSTADTEDQVFLFKRRGKKTSEAHRISSHSHQISIIENKSTDLSALEDTATSASLVNFPYTILLLDPSRQQQANFLNSERRTTQENFFDNSKGFARPEKEYQSLVNNLLRMLVGSNTSKRRIAVCLTKIDLLHAHDRDPMDLIRIYFGENTYSLIKEYRSIPNTAIQLFSVSSAGFIRDSSRTSSNFDSVTRNLLQASSWEPYNVVAPFFWLFENIEKELIEQSGGLFASKLFGSSRLKKYIPYRLLRS